MKIIQSALFAVLALLALTSASSAGALSGVYLEVGSSAVGVELDGNHNDTSGDVSTGSLGKTAVTGSYGLGFMTDRSRKMGLDFGYISTPGEAKFATSSDHVTAQTTNVTFEVSDSTEYFIAPMINITEDASLYIKFGQNDADVKVTGDVTDPGDLSGSTVALGTVMSWGSNLFIRTEAGMTDYDTITTKGKSAPVANQTGIANTTIVTASPSIHYGRIAIGYKF
jgi:hypothetical protein